jgi:hypothetical protein
MSASLSNPSELFVDDKLSLQERSVERFRRTCYSAICMERAYVRLSFL